MATRPRPGAAPGRVRGRRLGPDPGEHDSGRARGRRTRGPGRSLRERQRCRQPDNAAASNVAAQSAAGHDSADILQTVLAETGIELVEESSMGAAMAAREATLELTDLDLLARVHPDR